jgi:hypothetical protein
VTVPGGAPSWRRCLGGKYQPVGDDFKGSTIAAPAGAGEVYGLEDALKQPR